MYYGRSTCIKPHRDDVPSWRKWSEVKWVRAEPCYKPTRSLEDLTRYTRSSTIRLISLIFVYIAFIIALHWRWLLSERLASLAHAICRLCHDAFDLTLSASSFCMRRFSRSIRFAECLRQAVWIWRTPCSRACRSTCIELGIVSHLPEDVISSVSNTLCALPSY